MANTVLVVLIYFVLSQLTVMLLAVYKQMNESLWNDFWFLVWILLTTLDSGTRLCVYLKTNRSSVARVSGALSKKWNWCPFSWFPENFQNGRPKTNLSGFQKWHLKRSSVHFHTFSWHFSYIYNFTCNGLCAKWFIFLFYISHSFGIP